MPVCFIEAPSGLSGNSKKVLLERVGKVLNETFQLEDERVFLHEHSVENTSQNGAHASEVRTVCRVEAPVLSTEPRRRLAHALNAAVSQAYPGSEPLIFMNGWPLENVAHDGRLIADIEDAAKREGALA